MKIYSWEDVTNFMAQNIFGELSLEGGDNDIVLFGAGNAGNIALGELLKKNIKPVAFSDNDPNKAGSQINKIPIISPQDILRLKNPLVIVSSEKYFHSISMQLTEMGVRNIFIDAVSIILNLDKLKSIYDDFLCDERSKHVFSAIMLSRISCSYEYCSEVFEECIYYAVPSFKFFDPSDVIVDCGAFVGDTIQELIEEKNKGEFAKIYAFEPGERQFKALSARVERLKKEWALLDNQIICIQAGVGANTKKACLKLHNPLSLGASTVLDRPEGGSSIDILSLDEFFSDKDDIISFIKADIEGYELEMLKGAQNIIKKYKPDIALSIYHKGDDFFEIPSYIRYLAPEYKFFVRHHGPRFYETVCYCTVNDLV